MTDGRHAKGYFVEPTLFDNTRSNMRVAQEEIFGPVVCLITAGDFEEAVELANDVKYGLSSSLYSNDMSKIIRFAEMSEAGKVHINSPPIGGEAQAPFGGTKATGIGPRECGSEAFEFYTETKTVYVNYGEKKKGASLH
jgi:aldehyde dehydrogenase (NAD+)